MLDTEGWGLIASLEGGYPIALPTGWTIEPEAQAVFQRLSFSDGADRLGRVD
jgi:outer membrane autotransporter protein